MYKATLVQQKWQNDCASWLSAGGDASDRAGDDGTDDADDAQGHVPRPRPHPSRRRAEAQEELGLPCPLRLQ